MNFAKLGWHISETFRILVILKILFALDLLLVKAMYFKMQFCSTCTDWMTLVLIGQTCLSQLYNIVNANERYDLWFS